MACFVQAVYDLVPIRPGLPPKDSIPLPPDQHSSYPFHYRLVEIIECHEDEAPHGHIVGAIFEWKKDSPVPTPPAAPEVVVALRGTNVNDRCDLMHDVFLAMMDLHTKPRYSACVKQIEQAIDKHGVHKAWVTGHSLGAAICLLAGRHLAAQRGLYIHAHVFNPPFPSFLAYESQSMNCVHRMVVEMIAVLLPDKEERLRKTRDDFLALKNWQPDLYVNRNDRICSSYINYFCKSHLGDIHLCGIAGNMAPQIVAASVRAVPIPHSLRALIATLVHKMGSQPFHLIPCAYLHIADDDQSACKAHSLKQWFSQHVNIQSHHMQLV